ncbi:MAG: prolipoprotein diacylglyceryl transferase, partial [Treponema sp.]|nr:prolipoprotein diacylglyceryl transferase [Treponema sp.]
KKKPFDGFIGACYTIGYGLFRFIIEYFREPDSDLGYRISFDGNKETALNTSLLNISTGQIFCTCMIIGGLALMLTLWILHKRKKESGS